ncbi:acetylcholinesterase [Capsaspora owczarzaki ATCC 30864]|uniref:Acetylcholinesterase n=1 Tax=Capsaspora owczarzaki (strain ATCC 30864) TaxID=595528 RepID=A0A0D2WT84_CAPO3|nr:acetylcholinesterase [Capsaspora owczarzaki ATCC 30864]KJE94823.1 acetylcholinesterase [Capsaspora owczarzaki ATCC 30864]|eukprot:XP_004346069.2 acetylcholinesterase [Capsaspora owczarzaki ATCC 30864]
MMMASMRSTAATRLMLVSTVMLLAAAGLASAADPTLVLQTNNGPVKGNVHANGVVTFHDIPFAEPPVGELRFASPLALQHTWTDPIDCTSNTSLKMCPQARLDYFQIVGTEDCLYLDIYMPPNALNSSTPLPVMFWIYGGGYMFGDKFELGLYNGINLALNNNAIIVAANYRVNVFGFLASSILKETDALNSTGNFGLLDQRQALQWTRDNILHFNGNKNQITIFGESAGAFSVCFHLTSPASRGMFASAIMESGTCSSTFFFQTLDNALDFGALYASTFGCNATTQSAADFLKCLRTTKAEDLMAGVLSWFGPDWPNHKNWPPTTTSDVPTEGFSATPLPAFAPVMPWGPVMDGSFHALSDLPLNLITRGDFAKVPLITGTNANEGVVFVPLGPLVDRGVTYPLTDAGFDSLMHHLFNDTTAALVETHYPRKDYLTNDGRATRALTDFFFTCDARRTARAFNDHNVTVHLYQYIYKDNFIDGKLLGDYHASELYFVWDNQVPAVVHDFNEKDRLMAATFGTYWTNMPKVGSPNASWNNATLNPTWPAYTRSNDLHMALNVPPATGTNLLQQKCDFWDSVQGGTVVSSMP